MSVKDNLRRTKFRLKRDFFTLENIALLLAIVLCLVWTYQSIVAMSRNWKLSETLITEKKELELLNVEVEAAELENEYYKTNEYQELMARKILDKKLSGENMVILPDNSEEAKNKLIYTSVPLPEKLASFAAGILPIVLFCPNDFFLPFLTGIAGAIITCALLFLKMKAKIKGYTGDCCGATFILAEVVCYVIMTFHTLP